MTRQCTAFALLITLAACGGRASEEVREAVLDTTLETSVALLPGFGAATVTHTFDEATPEAPVRWRRLVMAESDTLYREAGDTAALDGFFADLSAFSGCATAEACRRAWLAGSFATVRVDTLGPGPLDAFEREVARGYLIDKGMVPADVDSLLDALDAHYATAPRVTLQFTESPTSEGPVWVYHPEMRRLLPVATNDL